MALKKLVWLSMLAALLTASRLAFVFLPNVKPNTDILILTSFVLGPISGVILAVISTLTSNFFLGNGIWTFGQMLAWGTIALISGLIGRRYKKIPFWILVIYSGCCGLLFGIIMTVTMGIALKDIWAYYLMGLPFDIYHAIGNMVFYVVLAKPLLKILEKQFVQMGSHSAKC